uniref:Uncharacterized protein n=1 Tax=viral metagenome TaxID=1070528 RepID=A0A6C0J8D5_9ZZZZ
MSVDPAIEKIVTETIEGEEEGIPMWSWFAIAGVVLVVLIIIALIIALVLCSRKKKDLAQPLLKPKIK